MEPPHPPLTIAAPMASTALPGPVPARSPCVAASSAASALVQCRCRAQRRPAQQRVSRARSRILGARNSVESTSHRGRGRLAERSRRPAQGHPAGGTRGGIPLGGHRQPPRSRPSRCSSKRRTGSTAASWTACSPPSARVYPPCAGQTRPPLSRASPSASTTPTFKAGLLPGALEAYTRARARANCEPARGDEEVLYGEGRRASSRS